MIGSNLREKDRCLLLLRVLCNGILYKGLNVAGTLVQKLKRNASDVKISSSTLERAAPSAMTLRKGSFCDEESLKVNAFSVGHVTCPDDNKEAQDQRAEETIRVKCQHRGSCSTFKSWRDICYDERI